MKRNNFIHQQISTTLIVFHSGIYFPHHIHTSCHYHAYWHLLEEGGFESIARKLLKFSEVLKWDGLIEEKRRSLVIQGLIH